MKEDTPNNINLNAVLSCGYNIHETLNVMQPTNTCNSSQPWYLGTSQRLEGCSHAERMDFLMAIIDTAINIVEGRETSTLDELHVEVILSSTASNRNNNTDGQDTSQ
jgi:hypothetical protein